MSRLVLVADDDEDILALLAFRLEREGYDVLAARDGGQALALTRERRPAVAVFDVAMPRLDGYEVTRAIRAEGAGDTGCPPKRARGRGRRAPRPGGRRRRLHHEPFSPAHLGWRLAELLRP